MNRKRFHYLSVLMLVSYVKNFFMVNALFLGNT